MKRRILSVLLAACMLFSLVIPALALDTATLEVAEDGNDGNLKAGDTLTVTATVPAVSGITSGFLKIKFNKTVLEATAIDAPSSLGGYGTTVSSITAANNNGFVSISIGNAAFHNFDMDQDLVLTITFGVKDDAPTGNIAGLIAVDTADGYYFENEDGDDVTPPAFDTTSYDAVIMSEIAPPVEFSVNTLPRSGAATSSVTGSASHAAVMFYDWKCGDTEVTAFEAGKTYTASVEVMAAGGSYFADGLRYALSDASQGTLTFVEEDGGHRIQTYAYTYSIPEKQLSSLEITDYTGGQKVHGDTVEQSELTVKATYDDDSTDTDFKDYEVVYHYDWSLTKGDTFIKVSSGSVVSAEYTIPEVKGITPTADDFPFTDPSLTYDGTDRFSSIIDAISPASGITAPRYTVKYDGSDVTEAINAGSYVIYAECDEGGIYEAAAGIEVGTAVIEKKTPVKDDFTAVMVFPTEYDGNPHGVSAPTLKSPYTGVGTITVKYNGETGEPVNAGLYEVTFDVDEGDNFTAATGIEYGFIFILPAEVTVTGTGVAGGTYGDKLGDLTITGLTTSVPGAWAFNDPDEVPYAGTAGKSATFTPTDSDNYMEKSADISVTIAAADQTPSITATATLAKGGNILDLATLVSGAQGEVSFSIKSGDAATLSGSELTSGDGTGDVVITVSIAAKDVGGTADPEYNAYTGDGAITVSIVDKADAGVVISGASSITKTYGDEDFNLVASAGNTGEGGTWTWSSSNTAVATVADGTVTITGQGTANITARYESMTTVGEATVALTVEKKTIAESDFTALPTEDKTYDGTAQTQAVASSTLTEGTDYEVVYSDNTAAGTASYAVNGIGNYKGTINKEFTIKKADPTVTGVNVTSPAVVYDSNVIADIVLSCTSDTPGSIALDAGQTLAAGTASYRWTFTPTDGANYNSATGTVGIEVVKNELDKIEITTPPAKTAYAYGESFDPADMVVTATFKNGDTTTPTDYTFSPDGPLGMTDTTITVSYTSGDVTKTAEQAITVAKAAAPAFPDESFRIKYSAGSQSYELALTNEPADAANAAYAVASVTTSGSGTASAEISGKTLALTISGFTSADVGETVNVTLSFTSDNYDDSTVNVTVTLTDRDVPTVTVDDITVTYTGSAVGDDEISGTAEFDGAAVEGTWAFKAGQDLTNVDDSGVKTVVFTPADAANYAEVETTLTLTIEKADVTGSPTYTAISEAGKTLADAAIDASAMEPAGTIAWDDGDSTEVTQGTAYGWTYTPTDSANYNEKKGTITPWPAPYVPPTPPAPAETVVIGDTEHGTVTADPTDASEGDTVTLTVTPDEGYELGELKVTDAGGNEIELTDNGDGTYTFTMPAGKVNVSAKFEEAEPFRFDDVRDENEYYFDPVYWAYDSGITTGTTPTTFEPDGYCTRGQTVTFLWRAAGCPEPASAECPFTDVDESAFYYKAVLWAAENGVTTGTTATTFEPDATVTRAQTVTFLWRAMGQEQAGSAGAFTDVEAGSWYEAAVAWAVGKGVTTGTAATTFEPAAFCLRGQMVTFLYRAYAD